MNILTTLRRNIWAYRGRRRIQQAIQTQQQQGLPIKVILGSSDNQLKANGWINTDIPQFDITNAKHWQVIFGSVKIDNLLAEHVLEHLTQEQIKTVLTLAKQHLKPGGRFRIAIPDKNNTDPVYQEETRPGGSGAGAHDHKVFLDIDTCKSMAASARFAIQPLEYMDAAGTFHYTDYDFADGNIQRSKKNNYHYEAVPGYTSLVFDLVAE